MRLLTTFLMVPNKSKSCLQLNSSPSSILHAILRNIGLSIFFCPLPHRFVFCRNCHNAIVRMKDREGVSNRFEDWCISSNLHHCAKHMESTTAM
jgi:hypothetical protein